MGHAIRMTCLHKSLQRSSTTRTHSYTSPPSKTKSVCAVKRRDQYFARRWHMVSERGNLAFQKLLSCRVQPGDFEGGVHRYWTHLVSHQWPPIKNTDQSRYVSFLVFPLFQWRRVLKAPASRLSGRYRKWNISSTHDWKLAAVMRWRWPSMRRITTKWSFWLEIIQAKRLCVTIGKRLKCWTFQSQKSTLKISLKRR